MIYSSFDTLINDIIGYIRMTDARILRFDDPLNGMIGYISEDEVISWQISLLLFDSPMTKLIQKFLKNSNTEFIIWMQKEAKKNIVADYDFVKHFHKNWHKLLNKSKRIGIGCHAGFKLNLPATYKIYS